jgi:uncharacterized protein YodC (DUF2158 family)
MTTIDLEKGMLVRLKSGGPTMTVRAVSGTQAYCEWFTEADRRQGTFEVSTLDIVNAAQSSEGGAASPT